MSKIINNLFGINHRKNFLLILVLSFFIMIPNSAPAQSLKMRNAASKSWNTFWGKFSTAVKNKDRKTIVALAAKDFFTAGGETVQEWFDGWSNNWREVRKSVNGGTMSHGFQDKKIWRITRDKNLLFVFEDNRWSFYGEFENS